jgi:hypothetical protein
VSNLEVNQQGSFVIALRDDAAEICHSQDSLRIPDSLSAPELLIINVTDECTADQRVLVHVGEDNLQLQRYWVRTGPTKK